MKVWIQRWEPIQSGNEDLLVWAHKPPKMSKQELEWSYQDGYRRVTVFEIELDEASGEVVWECE